MPTSSRLMLMRAISIRPTTRRTTPARSGMARWSYYSVRAGLGVILTRLQGPWSRLWTKLLGRLLDCRSWRERRVVSSWVLNWKHCYDKPAVNSSIPFEKLYPFSVRMSNFNCQNGLQPQTSVNAPHILMQVKKHFKDVGTGLSSNDV